MLNTSESEFKDNSGGWQFTFFLFLQKVNKVYA